MVSAPVDDPVPTQDLVIEEAIQPVQEQQTLNEAVDNTVLSPSEPSKEEPVVEQSDVPKAEPLKEPIQELVQENLKEEVKEEAPPEQVRAQVQELVKQEITEQAKPAKATKKKGKKNFSKFLS